MIQLISEIPHLCVCNVCIQVCVLCVLCVSYICVMCVYNYASSLIISDGIIVRHWVEKWPHLV